MKPISRAGIHTRRFKFRAVATMVKGLNTILKTYREKRGSKKQRRDSLRGARRGLKPFISSPFMILLRKKE